jgi:hypothetical protein
LHAGKYVNRKLEYDTWTLKVQPLLLITL